MEDNYQWLSVPIGSIKRLVIDGNSLCYKLFEKNRHEWVMGGDYPGFHRTVTAFFDKVQKLGIHLHIILDGIDYKEEKTTTVRKRQEQKFEQIRFGRSAASVLPLLARLVFVDALQGADLLFYIADGEADAEIAAVANFYRCPVLADDSDFYIFNIIGGYIPLQHFFETLEDETDDVGVYNIPSMAHQFNLQDRDLRLLIPAILGNDFMMQVPCPNLRNPGAIIRSIRRSGCLSMRQFLDSVPDSLDKKRLRENYSKAAALYNDVKPLHDPAELSEVTNLNVPKWMLDQYRKGCLAPQMVKALMTHKCILPVVVDDVTSKCAHYIGQRIRQYTYGILDSQQLQPVQETVRDNGTPPRLTDKERQCRQLVPPLSLDMICGLQITEKTQILCSVLCCHTLVDCIEAEWQLVMASCIYWYKKAKPTPMHHLVKALVQCMVVCHDGQTAASQREYSAPKGDRNFLETLHAYAQWQCTYFDAVALNQLLMEPLKYVSPACLYSGEVAMHYAAICSQSETCELTEDQNMLYNHLMKPLRKLMHDSSPHKKPQVMKQIGMFSHPNRFAVLQESHSKKAKK